MAVGDFYRASAIYSHPNATGEVVNLYDYEQTDIEVVKTEDQYCTEIAVELAQGVEADFLPSLSDAWTFLRVNCFNIDQPTFEGSASSGNVGGIAGDSVAIRSAPVVTKLTGFRGRSFRGRTFLPAPLEVDQDGGVITSGHQTVLQTFMDNQRILVHASGNRYVAVVYSEKLITGTQIGTYEVKLTMGSIRGRQKVNA